MVVAILHQTMKAKIRESKEPVGNGINYWQSMIAAATEHIVSIWIL